MELDEKVLVELVPRLREPHRARRDEVEAVLRAWLEGGGGIPRVAIDDSELGLLLWFRLRHATSLVMQEHKRGTAFVMSRELALDYFLIVWWRESEELFWAWILDSWKKN